MIKLSELLFALFIIVLISLTIKTSHAAGVVAITSSVYADTAGTRAISGYAANGAVTSNNHYYPYASGLVAPVTIGAACQTGVIPAIAAMVSGWSGNTTSGQCYFYSSFNQAPTTKCPANSTGTTSCTCTDPWSANSSGTFCQKSSFQGNSSTVCDAAGNCTSTAFPTAAAACASYPSANQVASLVGSNTCKIVTTYADGSTKTSYRTITGTLTCDPLDTACVASAATLNASAVASTQTLSQSAVSAANNAAVTAAQNAAAAAASAAGGSASDVAAAKVQAAASVAAQQAAAAVQAASSPNSTCDILNNPEQCLGKVTAESAPSSAPTFATDTVVFSSALGCPAPINFTITNLPFISKAYSISWQPFCDLADMLKPIFLALGAITAAFIFASVSI